jgi:putative phosphoribosyl transferase
MASITQGLFGAYTPFHDRADAGRRLAQMLEPYADRRDVIVLGLARGGVPVAFEIAQHLHAPLDIFLVRKLGVPGTRNWRWARLPPVECKC